MLATQYDQSKEKNKLRTKVSEDRLDSYKDLHP